MIVSNTDVICDEDEFTLALNKISNYISFIERKQEEFSTCMSRANDAISSHRFSVSTASITPTAKAFTLAVANSLNSEIKPAIKSELNEIVAADIFSYPSGFLEEVRALLSQFF